MLEEIKNINSTKKELRKFGLTVGIILTLIGVVLLYYEKISYPYFIGIGVGLIIFGLTLPILLLPLQKVWMTLSIVLGFFMTRLILSILFYLIITPIGLIGRLFGKDFLDKKIENDKSSYWYNREIENYSKVDTERQF